MIRLHVTAEGQAEQQFVNKVLAPHLSEYGVYVDARAVLTSKDNRTATEYRGGLISYIKAKSDIATWMKEDNHPECSFTTMFDLYALPEDFPGYAEAQMKSDPYVRVKHLENSLDLDINDHRFIPYIQLHEFEALLLADPQQLDWEYLEHDRPIRNLLKMVGEQNPELINDGPSTAPSKRILQHIPEYNKASAGPVIAQQIGLSVLRDKCKHFDEWVTRLEELGEAQ